MGVRDAVDAGSPFQVALSHIQRKRKKRDGGKSEKRREASDANGEAEAAAGGDGSI